MGRNTDSDICTNVAEIGDPFQEKVCLTDQYGSRGWFMEWNGSEVGEEKELYADSYVKQVDDKYFAVHIVEVDDNGPYVVCGLVDDEPENIKDWVVNQKQGKDYSTTGHLDLTKCEFGGSKESVELFLKDFDVKAVIKEQAAVDQTI